MLIIRHCESTANVNPKLYLLDCDAAINLTPTGLQQAKAIAAWMNGRGVTRVISSPSLRAHQTASIVSVFNELDITYSDSLLEVIHGLEREYVQEALSNPDFKADSRVYCDILANGRSNFNTRSFRESKAVMQSRFSDTDPTLLLVSHDYTIRSLLGDFHTPIDQGVVYEITEEGLVKHEAWSA